jgi:iron complex outermembrane receptor protein
LEQLASVKIVSASKRSEALKDVPAAGQAVSRDDIARFGATSIPEALRNVPGLNMAQINSETWAIGARGFPSEYAIPLVDQSAASRRGAAGD